MPKIVDHDQRRREIVEVTWRFIAREGIAKLNLRDLAAAAGYANGGLKIYFPTKDAILAATFAYVAEATNARIERNAGQLEGLAAVEAFAHEVLPVNSWFSTSSCLAVAISCSESRVKAGWNSCWAPGIRRPVRRAMR